MTLRVTSVDTFLNVTKRRDIIAFHTDHADQAASIGYFRGPPAYSDKFILYNDRSGSLEQNAILAENDNLVTFSAPNQYYVTAGSNLIFTDIFISNADSSQTPLWYQHRISNTHWPWHDNIDWSYGNQPSRDSTYQLSSVEILDSDMQPVSVSDMIVDTVSGMVYLNLKNTYVSDKKNTVYYVKYSLVHDTTPITYIDLLDSENIWQPLGVGTEWLDLANQHLTRLYCRQGFTYYLAELWTDRREFAWKRANENTFHVNLPNNTEIADGPWYLGTSDGTFEQTFLVNQDGDWVENTATYASLAYTPDVQWAYYSVPQSWLYDHQTGFGRVVAPSLIKSPFTNIVERSWDPGYISSPSFYQNYATPAHFYSVEVLISDSLGRGLAAFATRSDNAYLEDSSPWGDTVITPLANIAPNGMAFEIWNNVSRRGISSVDHKTGLIALEGFELTPDMTVTVNCTVKRVGLRYEEIDVNPYNNPVILNRTVVIFSVPKEEIGGVFPNTFHMILDETGCVIGTNYSFFLKYFGENVPVDCPLPSILFYDSYPSYLPQEWAEFITIFTKVYSDPRAAEEGVVSETTRQWTEGPYLVLAELNINLPVGLNDYISYETRTRGGGIKDTRYNEALAINQSVQGYWDKGNWDGIPYPGHATYLVEIPSEVLSDGGGHLSQKQVRDVVYRHTAAGVYPVARTYGIDISVSGIYSVSGNLVLEWVGRGR